MTKSQLFRLSVAVGSVFMILLIIVYWDNVGTAHPYRHTSLSRSFSPQMLPNAAHSEERTTLSNIDEFLDKFLNLSLAQNVQVITQTEQRLVRVRGFDWSFHDIKGKLDQEKVQAERKRTLHQFCANSSFSFPWKERSFEDIPNRELDHLIVDDRHGLFKKYTKFLFVRDPFVRLISAFRSKFKPENDVFYRVFAVPILKHYSNRSNVPASVSKAFSVGMKPSFGKFIQYLLDPLTEKKSPFNEHWRQVYRLCHPCQIEYDFIGKLETLDEDAVELLRLLGVDKQFHFPPSYKNRTTSSWTEDWFAKIPLEWKQQLFKLYEADFVLFGYSKPENLLKD
uniref:Carbohydrate sulfotransferase n=1 Tax=Geotrypetes seraphini TaxID=260995 RepID=A0A6P8P4A9_GEOSA|nr:LOW QUALITY PROTEIN: carbohydrate sulfotransferase 12-like [Geotrypetes seraphini]